MCITVKLEAETLKEALAYSFLAQWDGRAPADRCWHSGPGHWRFPGWRGWMDSGCQSSTQHAISQSQHHLSYTEHSAEKAHRALQVTREKGFANFSLIHGAAEKVKEFSHGLRTENIQAYKH